MRGRVWAGAVTSVCALFYLRFPIMFRGQYLRRKLGGFCDLSAEKSETVRLFFMLKFEEIGWEKRLFCAAGIEARTFVRRNALHLLPPYGVRCSFSSIEYRFFMPLS